MARSAPSPGLVMVVVVVADGEVEEEDMEAEVVVEDVEEIATSTQMTDAMSVESVVTMLMTADRKVDLVVVVVVPDAEDPGADPETAPTVAAPAPETDPVPPDLAPGIQDPNLGTKQQLNSTTTTTSNVTAVDVYLCHMIYNTE
eukprot:GHVN01046823.1.p2 GENE.GHVN01046823.1~~GHVN01046823.1.p2  ORF type:complete len:144 (-),score=26.57 GHVN01046823.1:261-692(-)